MQETIEIIRKASREIVREFGLLESDCARTGVNYAQGHALLEIEKYTVLTAGELSVILNLNRSSTARTLRKLKDRGWVCGAPNPSDAKRKPVRLTQAGREKVREINRYSDQRVSRALEYLGEDRVHNALAGMRDYAKALKLSRVADQYTIRLIRETDNPAVEKIIRTVSREFSTCGRGGPTQDPELKDMFRAYATPESAYFVVADGEKILGGAGVGPLAQGSGRVCEFRKMYFLPRARGRGLGEILMRKCIQKAAGFGYEKIYIETVDRMVQAVSLYEKLGARTITSPLGRTGHHQCEKRLVIDL